MMVPCKRMTRATLPRPQLTAIPDDLGEYIARNAHMVMGLLWEDFVKERRGQGEFSDLGGVDYSVCLLLNQ